MLNRSAVAMHEAGHAVICVELGGRPFSYVTIEPNASHQGRVRYRNPFDKDLDDVRRAALIAWSGAVASVMFSGLELWGPEATQDRENVIALTLMVTKDQNQGGELAEKWYREAWQLVRENEPAIQEVAVALLRSLRLTERQVRRIVKRLHR